MSQICLPKPPRLLLSLRRRCVWAGEVKRLALHFSQETAQKWSQVPPGRGNEGAAIWLPNRVLVELQMIPPSSRGSAADREEGMQGASGRGFLVTFSWAVKPDTVIGARRPLERSNYRQFHCCKCPLKGS